MTNEVDISYKPDEIENVKRDFYRLDEHTSHLSSHQRNEKRKTDLRGLAGRLITAIPESEPHHQKLKELLEKKPDKHYYKNLQDRIDNILIKRAPMYENGERISSDQDFRMNAESPDTNYLSKHKSKIKTA